MIYVGVDLGGTNIAAGVVDKAGKILHKDSVPTGVGREFEVIVTDMAELVKKVVRDAGYTMDQVERIGVGSPGAMDKKKGTVVFANNLFWHHVPLAPLLSEKTGGKPVYIDNDANVAGLAELVAGGAKGHNSAILLTLGTGVGGGIVLDGKVFSGTHGLGAELGHMCVVIDGDLCTCGNRGCFERYTSATALINAGKKDLAENPDGAIAKAAGGDAEKVTAKIVIDAAKSGDPAGVAIFERYVYILSMGIITLINCFDPEVFVLGGGVANAGEFLLDAVRTKVEELIFYKDLPHATVELAILGNDAGIIGAAMLTE